MARHGIRFIATFLGCLVVASILLEIDMVATHVVNPITAAIARVSGSLLAVIGVPNQTYGTAIRGDDGFSVNILDGCNGMDVTAIVLSAVLAFPSTFLQKGVGILIGILGVQVVNIIRIVTLYLIGMNYPALFERFHYYVWQTAVIVLSMAIWIFWAEFLVRNRRTPAPAAAPRHGPAS